MPSRKQRYEKSLAKYHPLAASGEGTSVSMVFNRGQGKKFVKDMQESGIKCTETPIGTGGRVQVTVEVPDEENAKFVRQRAAQSHGTPIPSGFKPEHVRPKAIQQKPKGMSDYAHARTQGVALNEEQGEQSQEDPKRRVAFHEMQEVMHKAHAIRKRYHGDEHGAKRHDLKAKMHGLARKYHSERAEPQEEPMGYSFSGKPIYHPLAASDTLTESTSAPITAPQESSRKRRSRRQRYEASLARSMGFAHDSRRARYERHKKAISMAFPASMVDREVEFPSMDFAQQFMKWCKDNDIIAKQSGAMRVTVAGVDTCQVEELTRIVRLLGGTGGRPFDDDSVNGFAPKPLIE